VSRGRAAEEARASWDEKQANEAVRARRLGDSATSVADVLERVQLEARVADRRMARRALEQRGGRHFDHAAGWPVSGQSPSRLSASSCRAIPLCLLARSSPRRVPRILYVVYSFSAFRCRPATQGDKRDQRDRSDPSGAVEVFGRSASAVVCGPAL
jgi:hypothetical protein